MSQENNMMKNNHKHNGIHPSEISNGSQESTESKEGKYLHLPEIPETATEEYLEKLTEKILKQFEKTTNKQVKVRLTTLLQEVQRRKRKLLSPPSTAKTEIYRADKRAPLFDTTHLSRGEQQQVKARLKNVLEEIKKQRPESQQQSFQLPLSPEGQEEEEESPQALLNTVRLTDREYDIVKERMKDMLADVEQQQSERQPEIVEEEEKPEQKPAKKQETSQREQKKVETFSFDTICQKVNAGEPLALFDHLTLTEREQAMLQAFEGHIKQTKSLKRQQVFDIQHLTSRSIRELDQLFKTYHLHGYLSVELHNIYNRLLNLRSRISILLS